MQKLMGLVRRCVDDYNMIAEGDKIAVGVSGGKDSLVLLVLLAGLRVEIKLNQGIPPPSFSISSTSWPSSAAPAPPWCPSR